MKCRCTKTQKRLVTFTAGAELPADLRRSVEQCPECRAFWMQTRRLAALIALKRYERPDEQALERCVIEARRRVSALEQNDEALTWGAWWGTSMPAFRFSMAALFIALLGLHMLSVSRLPSIHTSEQSLAEHVRENQAQRLAQDERPNPEFSVMMLSNWSPRVQQNSAYQFIGLDR